MGLTNKKSTAIAALRVTGYDEYRNVARFYFLNDNFERFGRSPLIEGCDMAVLVVHYDERWICYIVSLEE